MSKLSKIHFSRAKKFWNEKKVMSHWMFFFTFGLECHGKERNAKNCAVLSFFIVSMMISCGKQICSIITDRKLSIQILNVGDISLFSKVKRKKYLTFCHGERENSYFYPL